MNKITRIGLDIAKNIFVLHAVNEHGKTVKRQTLDRSKVLSFFAQIEPCLVGIESCASSQHWAREIAKLGHHVKLMNPKFVVPCLLYTSPSPRDGLLSRMPSSA